MYGCLWPCTYLSEYAWAFEYASVRTFRGRSCGAREAHILLDPYTDIRTHVSYPYVVCCEYNATLNVSSHMSSSVPRPAGVPRLSGSGGAELALLASPASAGRRRRRWAGGAQCGAVGGRPGSHARTTGLPQAWLVRPTRKRSGGPWESRSVLTPDGWGASATATFLCELHTTYPHSRLTRRRQDASTLSGRGLTMSHETKSRRFL